MANLFDRGDTEPALRVPAACGLVDLATESSAGEAWFNHVHFGPTAAGSFG